MFSWCGMGQMRGQKGLAAGKRREPARAILPKGLDRDSTRPLSLQMHAKIMETYDLTDADSVERGITITRTSTPESRDATVTSFCGAGTSDETGFKTGTFAISSSKASPVESEVNTTSSALKLASGCKGGTRTLNMTESAVAQHTQPGNQTSTHQRINTRMGVYE